VKLSIHVHGFQFPYGSITTVRIAKARFIGAIYQLEQQVQQWQGWPWDSRDTGHRDCVSVEATCLPVNIAGREEAIILTLRN
jgi:hypothetical protein